VGWKSRGDWLGTGFVASRFKEFLPFEDAREFAHTLGLKNLQQWNQYCLSNEKPDNIPTNPNVIYSDAGWAGFGDWLGTKNVKAGSINYRDFEEARRFVRNLKLNSKDEWEDYCKSGSKPENIPTVPRLIYKSKGWIGFGDWLGTDRIATNDLVYREFESARAFARSLNLKSQKEWFEYCKQGFKPVDIPRNVDRTYKKLGWKGFGDWLGKEIN
jgi:exonuclease I